MSTGCCFSPALWVVQTASVVRGTAALVVYFLEMVVAAFEPSSVARHFPAPSGSRRSAVSAAAWVLAAAALGLPAACRPAGSRIAPSSSTPQRVELVVWKGTPEEIGEQHGRRLGVTIRFLADRYLGILLGGQAGRARALHAAAGFRDHLRPHHRAELDALAAAAHVPPEEALLANCFLDLLPSIGCSTISLPGTAAPDGVARFGRNLDFPSYDLADRQSLVAVFRPAGRHAFAAVTWPGLIGVLSGINEHGLAIANMEVKRGPRSPDAMPYAILYRTVLEECRTVEEAVALLAREPRQTANNLMMMDAAGHRAVIEITPASIGVRRGLEREPLFATNHQRGEQDVPNRCRRYDCIAMATARAWGHLDRDALWQILDQVAQGDLTLQSMIFEPGELVLHVATGKKATKRVPARIDLHGHLRPAPAD